jgi:hypothetical protein
MNELDLSTKKYLTHDEVMSLRPRMTDIAMGGVYHTGVSLRAKIYDVWGEGRGELGFRLRNEYTFKREWDILIAVSHEMHQVYPQLDGTFHIHVRTAAKWGGNRKAEVVTITVK